MPSPSSGLRSPILDLSTNLFETKGALGLCRTNTFVDSREQLVGFFHILSIKPLSKSCSVFRCQFFDRFLNFSQTAHIKISSPSLFPVSHSFLDLSISENIVRKSQAMRRLQKHRTLFSALPCPPKSSDMFIHKLVGTQVMTGNPLDRAKLQNCSAPQGLEGVGSQE